MTDLAQFAGSPEDALDDVLPRAGDPPLRLLIVGVNPGLWTAAVNAPFARPGNRFWPALHAAGVTDTVVDASCGLHPRDESALLNRGIGITNLVLRATARADELTAAELRNGWHTLVSRLDDLAPRTVAVAGITAFRTATRQRQARLGRQDTTQLAEWPEHLPLWVVPQPSGLNAHENIASLAAKWREVLAETH